MHHLKHQAYISKFPKEHAPEPLEYIGAIRDWLRQLCDVGL